eukprot:3362652-Pleurochrysis_carterae.AAC.1
MTSRRCRGCRQQVGHETSANTSARLGRRAKVAGQDPKCTRRKREYGAGVTLSQIDDGRH